MSKIYNVKKVQRNGYIFDSKMEADYHDYLLSCKDIGVTDIKVHPVYELIPKFQREEKKYQSIKLEADFEYMYMGKVTSVDVKGLATETSKLKRKLFAYFHPDKSLVRIVKYKGDRLGYDLNEKRKRDAKKSKKNLIPSD